MREWERDDKISKESKHAVPCELNLCPLEILKADLW